jgi:Fe2+ or Zn2+ uptake regulation protein
MAAAAEARRVGDDVERLLRGAGLRRTHQRAAVLAALTGADHHPTAEDVAERVRTIDPRIHLATVYRTLHVLEDHGVIAHVHLGHGPAVYHLAHERHAHAVCVACGHTVEVPEDLLGPLRDGLAGRLAFVLDQGHFALSGWCDTCAPPDAG